MPRSAKGPRLYLDSKRQQWIIRDRASFVRTGCPTDDIKGAEKALQEYLGAKHQPRSGPDPLIADVLLAYSRDHLPHTKSAAKAASNISALAAWWGARRVSGVTSANCRAYAAIKTPSAGRRDLETLAAAIHYWHKEHGPLAAVPTLVLPEKTARRERWLTRSEAAQLLWASRRLQHLNRFIMIGLYTGSRSGVILSMRWDQIDFGRGVMMRLPSGQVEDARKRAPPVRLAARFLSRLRRWKAADDQRIGWVCHYDGVKVTKLRRSWANAVQRAGLDDKVTPHTLRHTRATWLMQAGVDVWEAAGHLGMSPQMLQQTYGKHSPEFQKNAAEV
jgi:integrase